ncbi:MAG: carboxypeptidase-like regulatory domain-containing protein, partial [bacterium]
MNKHAFLTYSTIILLCFAASAQNFGRLTGSVFDAETGKPLEGTNVTVKGTNLGTATDRQGRYTITHLSPGKCTVLFSSVGYADLEIAGVVIKENETTQLDTSLQAQPIPIEEMTVIAASKRPERITEAPSAISAISASEVRRLAGTGQIPKLFEAEPGIDLVQNGVNDYNINARGFNSSLNRRMLV